MIRIAVQRRGRALLAGAVLAGSLGAAPMTVHAEDIAAFETAGTAAAASADPRTAALDEAFARAVTLVLPEVVDAATRKAQQAVLDKEIVQRSRVWVASFKVTADATTNGRRELAVLVRIDRDRVRAKLAELNIPTLAPQAAQPRSVAVLLRVTSAAGVTATYGTQAMQDVQGLGALAGALRAAGMTVKQAPATGPAARPDGDLPLTDDEARALAADAKVEQLAIAGVTVGASTPLRGIAADGELVQATIRVIARDGGKLFGQGAARMAAIGAEASVVTPTIERALAAAASDIVPAQLAAQQLAPGDRYAGDDAPAASDGVVLVRMPARTPWVLVQAEAKYLAGAKGVTAVGLRRISAGGWVLGVSTAESVGRVGQLAKKGAATVRVVGTIVEVTPAGTP